MKKLRVRKSGIPGSGPHPSTDSRFHCSLGGCCRVGLCFLLQSPARTTELAPHSCSGQAGEEQKQMPCPLFQQLWGRFSAKESWKTNWFRVTYWLNHLLTVGTLASSYSFETGIIPALHILISWELLGFFKLKKKKNLKPVVNCEAWKCKHLFSVAKGSQAPSMGRPAIN